MAGGFISFAWQLDDSSGSIFSLAYVVLTRFLERGGGREKEERGREISMCKRYTYQLPLAHP